MVAYEVFVGKIPTGKHVCHECDVPKCIEEKHLWLGTQISNMKDMWKKGRGRLKYHYGENHPIAKMTDAKICKIRLEYDRMTGGIPEKKYTKSGFQTLLAKKYDLTLAQIGNIIHELQWKHLITGNVEFPKYATNHPTFRKIYNA